MKFGPRFYIFFVYLESSLTNKRENFVELQNTTQVVCRMKDLDLPRNGEKWLCNMEFISDSQLVPKNTKCYLQCEEGYDVRSRKSIDIIVGLFHKSNYLNNTQCTMKFEF